MEDIIRNLEEELRALDKQKYEIDQRIHKLDDQERGIIRKNHPNRGQNKRSRDVSREEKTERREDSDNKRTRVSSSIISSRETGKSTVKPKVTSAIVSTTPVPQVGEKPRPSLDTSNKESKSRNRKLFGVLVTTLNQFKTDIAKKSEAVQRREELEQKIETKVAQEEHNFFEQQKKVLEEGKEKEFALREEIKKQQQEKELQVLSLKWQYHRDQLSNFYKTEAKPTIYYKEATKSNQNSEIEKSQRG